MKHGRPPVVHGILPDSVVGCRAEIAQNFSYMCLATETRKSFVISMSVLSNAKLACRWMAVAACHD